MKGSVHTHKRPHHNGEKTILTGARDKATGLLRLPLKKTIHNWTGIYNIGSKTHTIQQNKHIQQNTPMRKHSS